MKTALIGYTGFVGSNIAKNMKFTNYYNSKNINDINGKKYDLVISAGIRAEKYLANNYPERDFEEIKKFLKKLRSVKKIEKLVFISTVDVYKTPFNVDEDTRIIEKELHPYGKNRYFAEKYIQENFEDYLIVRLPGLFGVNLKKNFIYDMATKIPTMLIEIKFKEILDRLDNISKVKIERNYSKNLDGNYIFIGKKTKDLIKIFESINFTSINFTDSRSYFQFYNLNNLVNDIDVAIKKNIKILNISSEPITAKEIATKCFNYDFNNEIEDKAIANYNMKSKNFKLYNGENGYLYNKKSILKDIKQLIENMEIE